MGETPERLIQLQNSVQADQQAQPLVSFLNLKVTIHSNIISIFGDLLIYLWLTAK